MNKGFTFIELLLVIGLLALIMVMVSNNMLGLEGKQKDKEYEMYEETLEVAACTYFETSEYKNNKDICIDDPNSSACKIPAKVLYEKGLVSKDLKNPKVNQTFEKIVENLANEEDLYVKVLYLNQEKQCRLITIK